MQVARPKVLISPLQTELGVALHHLTGSRYRVDLHRPEFSSSYSEVKPFFNYLLHSVKEQSWPATVQAAGLSSSATTWTTRSEHWMMLDIPWDGHVESCCRQIKIWMTKNKLKLNEQKTEVLLCGPSSRRETVPVDCLSVGEASIPFSNVVKTLGVTLDAELSMEQHVSAVVRSCFFHIRSLSKVRPYITYKAASSIAVCLILSKLDYCNSLLSGLPQKQIKRLQAVQNAAARTVMKCKKTDHITPILRQLHWLTIQKRIRHKILSATYRSVHDNTPLYLSDLLQKHNPSRLLRSASRSLLDVPGPRDSKTKRYGQRAFRYVAPSLWNVLPESIKEKDSIQSFRPSLKTNFFTQG